MCALVNTLDNLTRLRARCTMSFAYSALPRYCTMIFSDLTEMLSPDKIRPNGNLT